MQKKKYPIWFYTVLIFIPLILLSLFEFVLRLADYGRDFKQWTDITNEKIILNPEIGARYFSNIINYPHSNHDAFDKIKKKNSFRIFVLGGSSAAGFPYQPNGSFSRYLRDRLELSYPDRVIEVINLGITAVNSITIRDLIPGVIARSPDLVIIYAGHNEFYGALGVGSTQSIGNNEYLIRLYLTLKKLRTTQFLEDAVKKIFELFRSDNKKPARGTLMARMAEKKSIKINSPIFNAGKEQFEGNIDYILKELNEAEVPLILGTLTSNILDQKPFYSFNNDSSGSADHFYKLGKKAYGAGMITQAESLLIRAKDLDGLRFRAPSAFNEIIADLANKYGHVLADIYGKFKDYSSGNIVGKELMTDHLHPTLTGQFIIGNAFYEKIMDLELLPEPESDLSLREQESLATRNFAFTYLDSQAANFRISNLLNDWPFTAEKQSSAIRYNLNSKIDSLAFKMVKENLNWEIAHQEAYKYYLNLNQIDNFISEIKAIISQYPYKLSYYNFGAQELIGRQYYSEAEQFLMKRYKIEPDLFSTKWLGNISLFNGNHSDAVMYLNESISFNENDPQIYYNLAVAYLNLNNLTNSLESVKISLKLDPENEKARKLFTALNKKAGM